MATNAYIWGWPMVNQFNRRAVVGSVTVDVSGTLMKDSESDIPIAMARQ
jgi:hypothetical protein